MRIAPENKKHTAVRNLIETQLGDKLFNIGIPKIQPAIINKLVKITIIARIFTIILLFIFSPLISYFWKQFN